MCKTRFRDKKGKVKFKCPKCGRVFDFLGELHSHLMYAELTSESEFLSIFGNNKKSKKESKNE